MRVQISRNFNPFSQDIPPGPILIPHGSANLNWRL